MDKNKTVAMGDLLEAIEGTSTEQIRELKAIKDRINALSGAKTRVTRSNGNPATNTPELSGLLRELLKETRKNSANNETVDHRLQMRSYTRNKADLQGNDANTARKAARKIASAPVSSRNYGRDERGRFASPKKIGGNNIVVNPRAPERPRGGSLYSQTPKKAAAAAAKNEAAAQREATEEQTKKLGDSQNKTNDLLQDLIKETRKKSKGGIVQGGNGGGGGLDIDVGIGKKGGFLRRVARRIFGRGGKKAAAGAASVAAGAATEAGEVAATVGRDASGRFIKKGAGEAAEVVAEKAGGKGLKSLATKSGIKAIGKVGLRAIPIIGTAINAGMDAVNGWQDSAGQAEAFGLKNGKQASTREKAEYSMANVADMGGLISGGSQLLSMGANALGMDKTAKALNFNTADMARGIDDMGDSVVKGVDNAWSGFKTFFAGDSDDKDKKDDERTGLLVTAIKNMGNMSAAGPNPYATGAKVAGDAAQTLKDDLTAIGQNPDAYHLGGTKAGVRNMRNNNFGNLDFAGQSGAAPEFGDKTKKSGGHNFAVFATPDAGIRAMGNQLQRYGSGKTTGQKLNTVDKIISTWAPGSDSNDTQGYIKDVSTSMGVKPNEVLNMDDPQTVEALSRAIAHREGGDLSGVSSEAFQASLGELHGGKWQAQKGKDDIQGLIKKGGAIDISPVQTTGKFDEPGQAANWGSFAKNNPTMAGAMQMATQLYQGTDDAAASLLASRGIGNFGVKQDKGLTLPAGAKMPASLQIKAASQLPLNDYGPLAPANINAATAPTINANGERVYDVSQTNKAIPVVPGQQPATTQQQAPDQPGIVDILRSSAADTFDSATRGLSGSTMLDGVMGGMNPFVADVMKPLTGAAGGMIDKLLDSGRGSIMDMLNGTPTKSPQITDMAMSGVTPTVSRDTATTQSNDDVVAQLKQVVGGLEKLIGVTKDSGSGGNSGPDTVKATAQPQPNGNIPMQGVGQAFEEMIRGLF